jgi:glycosyltransferase involved in cell wall biosynthesis
MHILYIFTSGHFFSPNNKKWFKLFQEQEDVRVSVLIQEPQEADKKKFKELYGNNFNILYFQNEKDLLKKNYFQKFGYLKSVSRKINQLEPDIIHIHGLYFIYLVLPLLFLKSRSKIVMNIWGSDFNSMYHKKLKNRVILSLLLRKSHLIWTNWLAMADSLRAEFPKYTGKIRTIPLGVTNELFIRCEEKDKQSVRSRFNIKQDEYLLLYTRGFVMNSNYHKILNALSYIRKDLSYKVIFHHFKKNQKTDKYLNQLIDNYELKEKVFISHSELSDEEIKALYELADLTFSVTEKEQFSRTIHEAILSDTHIILNDIEPYRYLKYFFNWNVDLVNVNDAAQMGNRIQYYITQKPETDWEYEKIFIEKIFKFEDKEELFKSVYENLMDNTFKVNISR